MKVTPYDKPKIKAAVYTTGRAPMLISGLDRFSEHIRLPLFRNGYALLFSGAATSALGLLYWALAARLYSAETVGLNSAMVSAMLLLSGMAQLSLNNVLVRFVPSAGRNTRALILWSYVASGLAAALLSAIFVLGVDRWSPALHILLTNPVWFWAFATATVTWSIFSLQDSALAGLRQAIWVPVENTLFAIIKVILLVVLAASLKQAAIFASWTVPVALSLIPVNWLILGRIIPRLKSAEPGSASGFGRQELLRYIGGNYIGSVLYLAYTNLLPILVANRAGPEATAYFFLPWMIAGGMQLIAANMTTSLTVEAALDSTQVNLLGRRVLKQTLRLLIPLSIGIFVGAPWLLQLFGRSYSTEGAALLRWLAVATLPNVLIVLAISIARVTHRSWLVVAIHASVCLVALMITYFLLPQFGIISVGWAWLASQTAAALILSATLLRPTLSQLLRT